MNTSAMRHSPAGDLLVAAPPLFSTFRRTADRVLEGQRLSLPDLPPVAMYAITSLTKADPTGGLPDQMRDEVALCGHVLRVANSPSYQPRVPIVSLDQAEARLGPHGLAEIVLTAALQTEIFRAPGLESDMRALWRRALCTAGFAKELARVARLPPGQAFGCGLFMDLGPLVLLRLLAEEARRQDLPAFHPAIRPEILALADEQASRASAALARTWALPPLMVEALTGSRPTDLPAGQSGPVALASFAGDLAREALDPAGRLTHLVTQDRYLGTLRMPRADLQACTARAGRVLRLVDSLLI